MNFLQICQRTASECGVAGVSPSSVVSQSGDNLRIVNWCATAWDEIQGWHFNWRWMRSRFTFDTTASDDTYEYGDATDVLTAAAIDRFARWWVLDEEGYYNIFCYLTSAGVGTQSRLPFIAWSSFRQTYKLGSQNNGYPAWVTVDPQNNLVFGPVPDDTYTISGEYQRGRQVLSVDADEPDMPSQYHMLIVYMAMQKFGAFRAAPEVMNRGIYEGSRLRRQLEIDQLPQLVMAGPLA